MATTIITKYGSGAPTASDVVRGELAVDTENGRLYTENIAGSVVELGTNPAANVTFGDNVKAIFGAGSDLQIYHDGSHSYISDQGTGQLRILASQFQIMNAAGTESMVFGAQDNTATLYYDNAAKLATTSTGIDVTGTVTADGLTVDGNATIGQATAATNRELFINGVASKASRIAFQESGTNRWLIGNGAASENGNFEIYDATNGNNFVITRTGNVGIGVSPSSELHVKGADETQVYIEAPAGSNAGIRLLENGTSKWTIGNDQSNDGLFFYDFTAASERVRIDSSGRLLVGKSVINFDTEGLRFDPNHIEVTTDNATTAYFNRLNGDGTLLEFYRGSSTVVGSIGATAGDIQIGSGDTALRFQASTDSVFPAQASGGGRGSAIDLGLSSVPFKDLYLSGSVNISNADATNELSFTGTEFTNVLSATTSGFQLGTTGAGYLAFLTSNSEAARINSSQELLVGCSGTASGDLTDGGFTVRGGGQYAQIASGQTGDSTHLYLYRKDGSSIAMVGTIGNESQDLVIDGSASDHAGLRFMDSAVNPRRNGALSNGAVDLGGDIYRWKDLYLSGTANAGSVLKVASSVNGTEASPHVLISGAASTYRLNMWLDGTAAYIGQDSSVRSLRLYSSAETAGAQLSAGATSFTTFSDERLKESVEPVENALQSLSGLRTVKYHLKDVDSPEDKKKIGVIAQDLVGVIDEVIDSTFRTGDDTEYMGVRYTELVPVLIKAIQEQQDLIESLTARIAALEGAN